MTKTKAINDFFSSFGISAYPRTSVPDNVAFPYLTYDVTSSGYGNTTNPTVSLWYYTDSEAVINAKAEAISKAIGRGTSFKCDDGVIYVFCTSGWQAVKDENDNSIKCRTTNMTITFNTL